MIRRQSTLTSDASSDALSVSVDIEVLGESWTSSTSNSEPSPKRLRTGVDSTSGKAQQPRGKAQQPRGRGLCPQGWKDVEGFEPFGLRVAYKCGKKLPKTQSWCFVPLIFSALGCVPEGLRAEGISTEAQIETAQAHWCQLFSHWQEWRSVLRRVIDAHDCERFKLDFLPKAGNFNSRSWTTSLVFGEPRTFGRLPHPQGRSQDKIIAMLPSDTQNQIFASVIAIATS